MSQGITIHRKTRLHGAALLLTLAALLLAVAPAVAQNHGANNGMNNGRPNPPPHRLPRAPASQQEHWRNDYRQQGYYRGPDIYYRAPPVVVLPPTYYQPPGMTLNFGFPLYF